MGEFVQNKKESTAMLFYKKVIYKETLQQQKQGRKNLTNFHLGEKIMYGRVNMYYAPIAVQNDRIKYLSQISTSAPEAGGNIGAVNFVVDSFNEMSKQFNKAVITGQISGNEKYLSNLKVYRGYEDVNEKYAKYYKIYSEKIAQSLKSDKENPFYTFDEFVDRLVATISNSTSTHPLTKTGFIKSKYCSIHASGLALEIADISYTNDQQKMDHFINSKNWEFYVKTCSSYGFLIDRDVPWRIVADIGNPDFMLAFANRYGLTKSKQSFMNRYYDLVHDTYFRAFKSYLLKIYNMSRVFEHTEINECGRPERTQTVQYEISQISSLFSDEYFLRLYFKIRLMEESTSMNEHEKQVLINEMVDYYLMDPSNRLSRALYFFEFIVNKTFDKIGSLSYINEVRKIRREIELEMIRNNKDVEDEYYQNSNLVSKKVDGEIVQGNTIENYESSQKVRNPLGNYGRSR